jgi:hypothetical protein
MSDPIQNLIIEFHGADAGEQQREWSRVIAELHTLRRSRWEYRIGVMIAIVILVLATLARAQTVVNLPAGVLGVYEFTGGNTYVGNSAGTTFKGTSPLRISGSNVVIRNISFDGNGIIRDAPGLSGLLLENVEIRNAHVAMQVNGGSGVTLRNSLIEKCDFPTWIADVSNLLIEQNELRNCNTYGFKVFGNSGANKTWTARRNWIHDCGPDFMAFEWQGQCQDWRIVQNLVEKIRFGPNFADNDHSLLCSAPMAFSPGPGLIAGNAIIGKQPRDGGYPGAWMNGHPAIAEAGGTGTVIENNIFDGGGVGVTVTDKDGPASVTIRNNRIVNVWTIWNQDQKTTQTVTATNNGAIDPGFTVDSLRALVGRNPSPVIVPPPATLPAPGPTTNLADYLTVVQQRDAVAAERDSLRAILRAIDTEADKIKGLIPR